MRWSRNILIFLSAILTVSSLSAQISEGERYRLVDPQRVEAAGNQVALDHPVAFRELRAMMVEFYGNAIDLSVPGPGDEIIPDDYETIYNWDIAARQSFIKETISLKQTPGLIREAQNIFFLHYHMARVYEKEKRYFAAAYHYRAALRYRPLSLTPEIWTDPARADLITGNAEKEAAKNYAARQKEFQEAQEEYRAKKEEFAVEVDEAFQVSGNDVAARLRDRRKKELADLQKGVDQKKKKFAEAEIQFENYRARYNKTSSRYLGGYALLVLRLDEEIRERKKILNSDSDYRNNRNFTTKQNWDTPANYQATLNLLETAARLNPENPSAISVKARLYRKSGDLDRAIFSYEQALSYNETAPPGEVLQKPELKNIYLRLAGLYGNIKRYVDSAAYYEKLLALDADETSPETRYELARIHTLHTGHYDRAMELFEGLLKSSAFAIPASGEPLEQARALRKRFYLHHHMITCAEKSQELEKLKEALQEAMGLHQRLEEQIAAQENELEANRVRLLQLREQRNRDRANGVSIGQEKLQEYYVVRDQYEKLKGAVEDLHSVRRSMDFKKIYFTAARLYEKSHRVTEALELYRVAESYGLAPDEARREARRLQKKYE